MGVGIDIVFIPRLEGKDSFAHRVLSAEEYEIYKGRANKAQFLAGRFACKEAFIKANHGRIKDLNMKEISVTYDEYNCPILTFREKRFEVSISHDQDYAIAIVTIGE